MDPSLRMVLANNIIEVRNTQPLTENRFRSSTQMIVPPRIDLRMDRSKPLQRTTNVTTTSAKEGMQSVMPGWNKGQNEQKQTYTAIPMSIQEEPYKTNTQMPGWETNQFERVSKTLMPKWRESSSLVQNPVQLTEQQLSALAQQYMTQPLALTAPEVPAPMPQLLTAPVIESGSKVSFNLLPPAIQYKDNTTKSAYYSKDVKRHYINIDTRYRSNASVSSTTNFRWRFFQPMKNIISLRIASVEIPNNQYAFSAAKQNITFQIKLASASNYTTITIREGNYSSMELQNEINDAIQNIDASFVFEVNLITGKTLFSHPTQQFNLIFPQIPDAVSDWGIGYNLGFKNPSYSNKLEYISENVVYIIGDIYYFVRIGDFEGVEHNREGQTRVAATAKIIANAAKYSMIYDNGSNFMTKQVDFPNPQNITSFDVQIVDSNNLNVDLLGGNWSCTLELVEILNSEMYTGFSDHLLKNNDTPR